MLDFTGYIRTHNSFATYRGRQDDIKAIDSVLMPFGLNVADVIEGPTLIQYVAPLKIDTNVTKLLKAQANLVIALKDNNVRMFQDAERLIIEKPGAKNSVLLGDLMTEEFKAADGLPIMVGMDAAGRRVYEDLTKAPHMLVSGTTGSGKSEFLHSAILSIIAKDPEVQIYGIDPKGTEFRRYGKLPLFYFVNEVMDALRLFHNLVKEMEHRYRVLMEKGYRDIEAANEHGEGMKRIVVVIDEFANLMERSGGAVEDPVTRIAEKARAVGIHLILATQYPIVKYVTGGIKANIEVRIALKVNSIKESLVALDMKGAESLMGRGDALLRGKGMFTPERVQCCYTTELEKDNVVYKTLAEYWVPRVERAGTS